MKKAVAILLPYLEAEKKSSDKAAGKVLMATVKGDVHDIGKNIVGVVLACNNYEVVDLGVMVPASVILEEARKHQVDVIGLSGLITPSLDEMVHMAKEMQREGFDIPLLIGGATTSKVHTAVKISPHYDHPVVHVNDASRAVSVVSSLLSDTQRKEYVAAVEAEYAKLRDMNRNAHAQNKFISLAEARKNRFVAAQDGYVPTKPTYLGNRAFRDYPLEDIAAYIDWTPFFHSWELKGSYPKILSDPEKGAEATKLFEDAQKMLHDIIANKMLSAHAVVGFYPAAAVNDDLEVYADDSRTKPITTLHTLRQQTLKPQGQSNLALADFVMPKESGVADYIGGFAVTVGEGIERWTEQFEKDHDDYSSIMIKALADRLAEAFAELMHYRVRTELWGYAPDENIPRHELIQERYRGIRPAQGYPACPDHTEKLLQFALFGVQENAGITLTESMAMYPASSVSGLYFSHPGSVYFGLGKITREQVEDYAKRKNMGVEEVEKWLSPNLAY
jgi:5-methyltetrahydrofolate--homocysteine methyltransferase